MLFSENLKFGKDGLVFTDKHGRKLEAVEAYSKATFRLYNWYWDFKLFLLHLVSLHVPLWNLRRFLFSLAGIKTGKGSIIHMGAKFFEPKNVAIGRDTIIGNNAFLDGRDSLLIGSHVDLASEVMIYNSEHDINDSEFKAVSGAVEVGDYVFIGPRAIILPNVKIGKGAVVAAGAVVTKNVPEFEIVGGVPAVKIGERKNKNPKYILGRARLFQ